MNWFLRVGRNEQPELKQRLVKAFPFWYLESLEKIIKEGNKLNKLRYD